MVMYSTGTVASLDDVVDAIHAAAVAAGWNSSVDDFADGGSAADEGRQVELDWGGDYFVKVRSVADLSAATLPAAYGHFSLGPGAAGPAMYCNMRYESGSIESVPHPSANELHRSPFIGPFPTAVDASSVTVVVIQFPVTYHIYVYEDPDMMMIVVQTGAARFQWMMFGEVTKFGTWTGGGFYGAIGTVRRPTESAGLGSSPPVFNLTGASTNRGFGPWHRVRTTALGLEYAQYITNTRLHCITGTSEPEIDDHEWTHNCAVQEEDGSACREGVANVHWSPLVTRSPNSFNEVSVMVPFWIQTQREDHVVLIGQQPHIRYIPMDNFNPGDTFELGNETWQVFPYFERGGITGMAGIAIKRSEGS